MNGQKQPSKYEVLKAERNALKATLDRFASRSKHPLYIRVRAAYDMKVREIKQMFKTHA